MTQNGKKGVCEKCEKIFPGALISCCCMREEHIECGCRNGHTWKGKIGALLKDQIPCPTCGEPAAYTKILYCLGKIKDLAIVI